MIVCGQQRKAQLGLLDPGSGWTPGTWAPQCPHGAVPAVGSCSSGAGLACGQGAGRLGSGRWRRVGGTWKDWEGEGSVSLSC